MTQPTLPPRRRARRVWRAAWAVAAAQVAGACYTYVPAAGPTPPDATVSLELTDQQRADLRGAIGEFPLRAEGRLASVTDSTYTLNVRLVESVRGETTNWSGEPVTFRRSGVSLVRVRRLDRGRTALASVGAVAGVVLFVASRSLIGLGGAARDRGDLGGGGGGTGSQ